MTAPYYLHLFCVSVLKIPAWHLYSSHVTASSGKLQFRVISTCYVPSVILVLVLFFSFFRLLGIKDSEGQYSVHG